MQQSPQPHAMLGPQIIICLSSKVQGMGIINVDCCNVLIFFHSTLAFDLLSPLHSQQCIYDQQFSDTGHTGPLDMVCCWLQLQWYQCHRRLSYPRPVGLIGFERGKQSEFLTETEHISVSKFYILHVGKFNVLPQSQLG